MAAPPAIRTVSNTSLLAEYGNGSVQRKAYRLPSGPCNFTNLAVGGASPPRCGCQRFWDQLEYANITSEKELAGVTRHEAGWCMCEHHACFHDCLPARSSRSQQAVASSTLRSSSQYSRRESSFSRRFPSQLMDPHTSQSPQAPMFAETDLARIHGSANTQSQANKHLTRCGLPDTRLSNDLVQSETIAPGLPPIPSQCNLPSDISSGGLSGNSQSFQSFPKVNYSTSVDKPLGDHTAQTAGPGQNLTLPPQHCTYDEQLPSSLCQADSFLQSATEVITPRSHGSPNPGLETRLSLDVASVHAALDILTPIDNGEQRNPCQSNEVDHLSEHSQTKSTDIIIRPATNENNSETTNVDESASILTRQMVPHLQTILRYVSVHPTLDTKVQNHEQRIDLLENVSCSYASAQEVHEGFDLFDERIGEVEGRVEELEKAQAAINDFSGVSSFRRRLRCLGDSDSSMASQTSSELICAAIERTEYSARLDSLESQFTRFQSSALPSRVHPWTVEVVFLPFGTGLKGIWSTIDQLCSQRSRNNSVAADNWTQSRFRNLAGTHSLASGLETGQQCWEDVHSQPGKANGLLVARACGQGSKVEERLRSRGLVKVIQVVGPEAKDVQAAVLAAFGDLSEKFRMMSTIASQQLPGPFERFYGLQAPWIPLRKLHKDSRLRFLDPSEMVTSALWTASFLSSSVVMRATGIKRLYITQRESYIQQTEVASIDWTWRKLRVLPRVFPDAETSAEVGEADALESCWKWDVRLDPPQYPHLSFDSQHSCPSTRRASDQHSKSSQSDHSSSPAVSPVPSITPTLIIHTRNASPLMEKSRRLHSRTTSMPSIVPLKISPPPSKRRIASFDHELHGASSPQSSPTRQSIGLATKRPRISRSPSRPRDTPRWSVGPPSPYYFEEPGEQKRGTTPFAYATPHSNAPYGDFRHHSVAGIALDDHDEHGSVTDDLGLDSERHDVTEFDSEPDHELQPEDEVWEGVGDEMGDDQSDQEQKALSIDDEIGDATSDLSSQPSEYPSTQPSAFYMATKGNSHIHANDNESYNT